MKKSINIVISFFIAMLLFPSLALAEWNVGDVGAGTNLPSGEISDILGNFLSWALGIFGILAVLGFIISGIMYITAAGNTTQIEKAKTAMKWSIVGVVVGLAGVIILNAVQNWLGGATEF